MSAGSHLQAHWWSGKIAFLTIFTILHLAPGSQLHSDEDLYTTVVVLPIKGLGKVHHTCQHCSLIRAVLAWKDKVDKLNDIVRNRVSFEASILSEVNFVYNVLQQPHHYLVFRYLAKEEGKGNGSEVILTLRHGNFCYWYYMLQFPMARPLTWPYNVADYPVHR